jgi:hypothetical protein
LPEPSLINTLLASPLIAEILVRSIVDKSDNIVAFAVNEGVFKV